jgi:hypothetical protein
MIMTITTNHVACASTKVIVIEGFDHVDNHWQKLYFAAEVIMVMEPITM